MNMQVGNGETNVPKTRFSTKYLKKKAFYFETLDFCRIFAP